MSKKFDSIYQGVKLVARSQGEVTSFDETSNRVYVDVSKGQKAILSGFYIEIGNAWIYQIATAPDWGVVVPTGSSGFGVWEVEEVYTQTPADANDYVNKLIKNNQIIWENNLLASYFLDRMDQSDKQRLYDLQYRLIERNEQLKDKEFIQSTQQSYPAGYINFANRLNNFMKQGVGVVVTLNLTAIVITAIVVSTLATAAYFLYKQLYSESAQDVKLSKELLADLKKKYNITDEDVNKIEEEMRGAVSTATIRSKFSSYMNVAKILLAVVAGGFGLYYLNKALNER